MICYIFCDIMALFPYLNGHIDIWLPMNIRVFVAVIDTTQALWHDKFRVLPSQETTSWLCNMIERMWKDSPFFSCWYCNHFKTSNIVKDDFAKITDEISIYECYRFVGVFQHQTSVKRSKWIEINQITISSCIIYFLRWIKHYGSGFRLNICCSLKVWQSN